MSRGQLSVASEILGLRVMIEDVMDALKKNVDLPEPQRQHLRRSFHHYISESPNNLRSRAISKRNRGVYNLPHLIIRDAVADEGPKLLGVIDKLAVGSVDDKEKKALVAFLSRVDAALDRGRASVKVGRYL